ncbi:MAG: hypothetical protein QXW10_01690 [Candidatus Micrarchaeaceae archaeon]
MDISIDSASRRRAEIHLPEGSYHLGGDLWGLLDLQYTILKADYYKDGVLRTFTRHVNPDGSVGGYVEDTAHVAPTVFMDPTSLVLERVEVSGKVKKIWKWVVLKGEQRISEVEEIGVAMKYPKV